MEMLPFKRGAFHVAHEAGVPLVPLVISPIDFIADRKNWVWKGKLNLNLIFSYCLLLMEGHLVGGDLYCKVLEPIPTKDVKSEDIGALADNTQAQMQRELNNLIDTHYSKQLKELKLVTAKTGLGKAKAS